jgi:preprotein translocase subunit SecD
MRLSFLLAACLGALALCSGASAGVAIFDVSTSLVPASRNAFGDLQVRPRAALERRAPGATLVRCKSTCTYGKGWLAFRGRPVLTGRDLVSARAYRVAGPVWSVSMTLRSGGTKRWSAFTHLTAKAAREHGVPDALVLAVDGSVAGQPLANQVVLNGATLRIGGLTRTNAVAIAGR